MKLEELLKNEYVTKIDENKYRCNKCNNYFKKLGVINHHFYEHEEEGIKKKQLLKEISLKNNNTPEMKKKISEKTKDAYLRDDVRNNFSNYVEKIKSDRIGEGNPMYGKKHTNEWKENHSNTMSGFKHTEETKTHLSIINTGKTHSKDSIQKMRVTKLGKKDSPQTRMKKSKSRIGFRSDKKITHIKKTYLFFSKMEQIRYNPDKPGEYEIQVHCKNHNCQNSKEKGGWFTPTRDQLYSRIFALEKSDGNDGNYFYCSNECNQECPLFGLNPNNIINKSRENEKSYTNSEYQTFRQTVLERDNHICQYCGKLAEHVHHERPQKLEPFFSLDPDLAWSVCSKCHYEKGHKDECSTGSLANKILCEGKIKI